MLLGDIADVREAPAVRRGVAHRLGRSGQCRVVKQFGADTVGVSAGIRAALTSLARSLPPVSGCAYSTTSRSWWGRPSAAWAGR